MQGSIKYPSIYVNLHKLKQSSILIYTDGSLLSERLPQLKALTFIPLSNAFQINLVYFSQSYMLYI